jgi:hypothetical protein
MNVEYRGEVWECIGETMYTLDLILKSPQYDSVEIKIRKGQEVKLVCMKEIKTV